MISVFGATGEVGGKVAALLLENGIPVKVLVRSPEKVRPLQNEGAEVQVGSLLNESDVRQAFDRCESAFLMTPLSWSSESAVEEEIAIGENYGKALKDSTIRHVVYISVVSARQNTGIPHFDSKAKIEDMIAASGVDCTFLRPTFFMENLYQQWPLIQDMGIISYPFPADVPLPIVAAEDVAYAAAQSLMRGGRGQEAFDMLGPRDYTMAEVAEIVGSITGREIRYVEASPEQAIEMMMKWGMSRVSAEDIVLMFDRYKTMQFDTDRNRVYDEFNFDPTFLETVLSTAAGALKTEAK